MSRPIASPSFRYGNRPTSYPRRASSYPSTTGNAARRPSLPAGRPTETLETVSDFILSLPHPKHWLGLLLNYLLLDPLRTLAATVLALITSPRTHRVALRLGVLIALFWAALILAIFAYIGFYRVWVPEVGRLDEVHLEYGRKGGEMPSALVDLASWTGYRGGRITTGEDWFAEEQEYDVTVELLVPISTANLDLGNFMVSLTLLSSDNVTLFHSSRPTILRPTTPPLRFLHQFASHVSSRPSLAATGSVAGLLGGSATSFMLPLPFTSPSLELMTIRLFDRVVLHPSPGTIPFSHPAGSPLQSGIRRRISKALVRVGRDDSDKYWVYGGGHGVGGVVMSNNGQGGGIQGGLGQGMVLATQNGGAFRSRGELQTVGVGLRFDARLTGLRYLLYTYPILSFIFFTSLFLAFELISALTLWTIAAVYTSSLPGLGMDLGPDNQFVPYRGAPLGDRMIDGEGEEEDEDDGSSTPRRRSRVLATPETITGDSATTSNADDEEGLDSWEDDTETEEIDGTTARRAAQARARASLRNRDAEERREVLLAAQEEAIRSGRLMTALSTPPSGAGGSPESLLTPTPGGSGGGGGAPTAEDLLSPSYRRVLGRLDEETEEETDDVASEISGSGTGTGSGPRSSSESQQRATSSSSEERPVRPTGTREGRQPQGQGGESQRGSSESSGRTIEGDDGYDEDDEEEEEDGGILIGSARSEEEDQQREVERQGQAIRRRKVFEGEGEGDEDARGEVGDDGASTIGGSATDPSIASGSRRSFGATTQASASTRRTD